MPKINIKSIPKTLNQEDFNKYFCEIAGKIDKELDENIKPH